MPSALPLADPAPPDGLLPASAAAASAARAFGLYLHVPFCRVRCGYCDFNTYTATELRGAARSDYASHAVAELSFAAGVLAASGIAARELSTVFVGGGTPTLLPTDDLARMLSAAGDAFGLARGAEVTVEANPDSVDAASLAALAAAGVTRVSFGMQSAVPHVLATLDRTHDPARIPLVTRWARDAGLEVSLDLIYGTPGESADDWRRSLSLALEREPDHLSAYALIVEPGTRLARRIARGELPGVDDDVQAERYEAADALLGEAGYDWYEVSNWARRDVDGTSLRHRSRHNTAYWTGEDWWGVGPGAHSHVGGVRWWNVKHPAAYGDRVAAGVSPAAGRETLDADAVRLERVLLGVRLADGLPVAVLSGAARDAVDDLVAEGLVEARAVARGLVVLTLAGRLLADLVVRRLTDA